MHANSISRSIIGIRSRIGGGTHVRNSMVLGNDFFETLEKIVLQPYEIPMGIGTDCYIENAIIDKNCRIGNDVHIIGDASLANEETETHNVVDGIIVLKKGATIPPGTRIGRERKADG